MSEKNSLPIDVSLGDFAKSLLLSGKTKKTVAGYVSDVKWLLGTVLGADKTIDQSSILTALNILKNGSIPVGTANRRIQGINSFLRYQNLGHLVIKNKVVKISSFRDNSIPNDKLSVMIRHCKEAADDEKNRIAKRTRYHMQHIMLCLGIGEGLRVSEYKYLNFADALGCEVVRINRAKHDGCREVTLTKETLLAIRNFYDFLLSLGNDAKSIWSRDVFRSSGSASKTISESSFHRWIKSISLELFPKVKTTITTHDLRRAFATNFYKTHSDINTLALEPILNKLNFSQKFAII